MGTLEERLKRLDEEANDRIQRDRKENALRAKTAAERDRLLCENRALVMRLTEALREMAPRVCSSFSPERVPIWNDTIDDKNGGGYFIIPGRGGPLGRVTIALAPDVANVMGAVSAEHADKCNPGFFISKTFDNPVGITDVVDWVESELPNAFTALSRHWQ